MNLLDMKGICKSYSGIEILDNADLDVREGEVLALVGKNGAGKSTLAGILLGRCKRDSGIVRLDGHEIEIGGEEFAWRFGLGALDSETNVIGAMSVAENILMGHDPVKAFGFIDAKKRDEMAAALLKRIGVSEFGPRDLAGQLSRAHLMFVSIAQAVSRGIRLLVMDEPTRGLLVREVEAFLEKIRLVKSQGMSVIYISHRAEEIFKIADRIAVLREGVRIATLSAEGGDWGEIVRMMMGRDFLDEYPKRRARAPGRATPVFVGDLEIRAGEVLGVAVCDSARRDRFIRNIYGSDPSGPKKIRFLGFYINVSPRGDSVRFRVRVKPEGQNLQNTVLFVSISKKAAYIRVEKDYITNLSWIDRQRMAALAHIREIYSSVPEPDASAQGIPAADLPAAVMIRRFFSDVKTVLFDEPSFGLDVEGRREVYEFINALAEQEKGVVVLSSFMRDIAGMSDRIVTLN
ncbi:MAG: ATP-binding cassette domain-containing protein [Synergistaceae bacterium]|nr:ATP-binding cassette domain-containing protein [Synergistaceae bacterium]